MPVIERLHDTFREQALQPGEMDDHSGFRIDRPVESGFQQIIVAMSEGIGARSEYLLVLFCGPILAKKAMGRSELDLLGHFHGFYLLRHRGRK
jgi:hypothetical protein